MPESLQQTLSCLAAATKLSFHPAMSWFFDGRFRQVVNLQSQVWELRGNCQRVREMFEEEQRIFYV